MDQALDSRPIGICAIRSLKPGHSRLVGGQGSTTSGRSCTADFLGAALGGGYLAYAMLESVPIIHRWERRQWAEAKVAGAIILSEGGPVAQNAALGVVRA